MLTVVPLTLIWVDGVALTLFSVDDGAKVNRFQ